MTELAYLTDMRAAYERRFTAHVVALPPGAVVLDRTYFYPAGGGQPCDRGELRTAEGAALPVVDVVKSGGSVIHRLGRGTSGRAGALRVGAPVEGEIDWERRHLHMRLHTAQHLVSAKLFELAGLKTRKAVLAGRSGFVDLERDWSSPLPWETLRSAVGAALDPPRPVEVRQVPRAEWELAPAARAGLVPLPPLVDPVRVIEIEGTDRCPCGGTHVRSTGEIGPIDLPPPTGARVTLTLFERAPSTPSE
ncbi:MAG TPA: alanyl-tRNA editing protein [Thermoplasmata archaeon]|nr:alanyl-tRNA editing protein [Thermoplasmata archaeon]